MALRGISVSAFSGNFTPTLIGSTGGVAVTSVATGLYVKVGLLVWFNLRVVASDITGLTGNIQIDSLPFTSAAFTGRNMVQVGACNNLTGFTVATVASYKSGSSTKLAITDTAGTVISTTALTATTQFDINGQYAAAS